MKPQSTKTWRVAWAIAAGLWVATGYVGLNSYMLHLGAAHHDAFCPEH